MGNIISSSNSGSSSSSSSSKPFTNPFQSSKLLSTLRASRTKVHVPVPSGDAASKQPSIFSTLRWPNVSNPNDFIPLYSDCISKACSRTQEYLLFKDPEDKFHPNPEVLTQIFLMTYIGQSINLNMMATFNCTVMTPEQRVLLGADWVWAVLEKPTKNPRIQIAVQVLHTPTREAAAEDYPAEARTESLQMAQRESSNRTVCERMVDFCASIGKDCYALFLFMGRKNDAGGIYGVLSNNFQAAIGKCDKIDRELIENFFKGSRYLHTPTGMLQTITTKRDEEPLTVLIKFS
ncbi:Rab15 effector protein [Merluccius polli]|uniref:Rab15 effector protein n=1 Tax=Merluccius polli TaxID=89951 RepID=A0AA47PBL3_MERPO|nr:Rab15 effector protein [Merluccius polli]